LNIGLPPFAGAWGGAGGVATARGGGGGIDEKAVPEDAESLEPGAATGVGGTLDMIAFELALVGVALATVKGAVSTAVFFAVSCAAIWACNVWLTESRLRCVRMSIGAVRFLTGTRRSDSRFFLAIVGGRISS
jgi:hypothetical protein